MQQGAKLVAKFRAKIATLKEEHAAEKKKLQSEHRAVYEAFYKGACADYSNQIKELSAEDERLKEENAEVKRLNQALLDEREEQFDKFEVLLGAKMDLEKDVKRKEDRTKDLEYEVAQLKKGLAGHVESAEASMSSSHNTAIQAAQIEKALEDWSMSLSSRTETKSWRRISRSRRGNWWNGPPRRG